jgi:hypothetical protein
MARPPDEELRKLLWTPLLVEPWYLSRAPRKRRNIVTVLKEAQPRHLPRFPTEAALL